MFEDTTVRVVDRQGEPWLSRSRRSLVLADVCRVLELRSDNVSRSLDDDEKGSHYIAGGTSSRGGNPNVTVISESGLYSVIFLSRKDTARRFKKWVTSEVLPMIRKTGMYVEEQTLERMLNDPAFLRSKLQDYAERVLEMQPKADFLDFMYHLSFPLPLRNAFATE